MFQLKETQISLHSEKVYNSLGATVFIRVHQIHIYSSKMTPFTDAQTRVQFFWYGIKIFRHDNCEGLRDLLSSLTTLKKSRNSRESTFFKCLTAKFIKTPQIRPFFARSGVKWPWPATRQHLLQTEHSWEPVRLTYKPALDLRAGKKNEREKCIFGDSSAPWYMPCRSGELCRGYSVWKQFNSWLINCWPP
jgi:hypothetical protein